MPEKKKQHYVPQFHLRNFSYEQNKTHISIYNIESQTYRASIPIKQQLQKPYFYGKDLTLDKILEENENKSSVIIEKIIECKLLPKENSLDLGILLKFILLAKNRTLFSSDQMNEMVDKTIKQIWSKSEEHKDFMESHNFGMNNAVSLVLEQIFGMIDLFSTLKIKILNTKNNCFITSDNPVIPYNVFLENRNHPGGHYGINTKGIIYYFPINSKNCLLVYDSKTYRIGNRKQITIEIDSKDLLDINSITFINSYKNVYFDGSIMCESKLNDIQLNLKYVSLPNGLVLKEYLQERINDDQTSTLMHQYRSNLKLNLKPSYLKITKKAKKYVIRNETVVER